MDAFSSSQTTFATIGANAVTIFGLSPGERARRLATKAGLRPVAGTKADVVADLGYTWDPAWLAWVAKVPGRQVTWQGTPVLTHGTPAEVRDASRDPSLYNEVLRKREDAYLLPLVADNRRRIEKASYDASYKGVTDVLTLYLWRGAAFHLTRWAAAARISPNMITIVGIAFCILALFLFEDGHYWHGLFAGLVFMVLDTVDGKLARCTGTSSALGNVLDHGVDLVHPPFWYWAWGAGLWRWGQAMPPDALWTLIAVIVVGYVVQRLVEGAFIARFDGIHIHVWERIDSRFRLVTARRNPNMVILFVALLVGEPRAGLVAVAWWTVLSCLFHIVRLAQALLRARAGRPVTSWLVGEA